MATLIKTPQGSWKAVVRKQGWPTVCKTFRTKRDAEDWSRRLEDEMVRGVYIQRTQSARMLFTDALDRYLAEITPTKKLSTQRPERVKAETLRLFFGRYAMSSINIELANKYRDRRIAEGKKPNTVRLELALASHLFNTAIREWRIGLPQNPFAGMRKPSVGPGRDRRLSFDEEQKLRSKVASHSNPMMRWIFEIAIETGMRVSEITGLTPSHVDLNRRIVRLGDTKNGEARTVPLTQHAKAMFAVAIANPARPRDCNLIFAGEPGRDGIRRPYQFNKIWSRIKASLGIKDLRFHDLRHEAVSRLVEAGLSDQEVSAISGHKSMQMLKRYTHLRAEDLVEKLDRVPNNTGTT
jgi:integrase